jgi:hypothetical protein
MTHHYRDLKLSRSSTCTQEAVRHGTLTLLNKVQFGPLQYPLHSHMSDLHLFIVASFLNCTPISLWRRRHSVALLFCTVIQWWWLEHHSWVELALSPQLAAEQVETDRDGNHDSGETAK